MFAQLSSKNIHVLEPTLHLILHPKILHDK